METAEREHWGVPFHEHAQIEIVEASSERGVARIPDLRVLKNHTGTVHGGMLFAVGEVAAAASMMGLIGDQISHLRAVTRRGHIDYLKPARGIITGEGRASMSREAVLSALEHSRSVDVPVGVSLRDADGLTVATLTLTWFVGRPRA